MAIPEEKPDTRFHYSYSFYLEWIYSEYEYTPSSTY